MTLTPAPYRRGITLPPEGACDCCEYPSTVGDTKLCLVREIDYYERSDEEREVRLCSDCLAEGVKFVLYPVRMNVRAGECEWSFIDWLEDPA